MNGDNQELVVGEPLRVSEPRSMVSLDHNGESMRVVCLGGNNTIVIGEGSTTGQPRSVTVSNVVWPSVVVMVAFAMLGVAIGTAYAETIRGLF